MTLINSGVASGAERAAPEEMSFEDPGIMGIPTTSKLHPAVKICQLLLSLRRGKLGCPRWDVKFGLLYK